MTIITQLTANKSTDVLYCSTVQGLVGDQGDRGEHGQRGERGEKGVQGDTSDVLSVLAAHLPIGLAKRYGEKMSSTMYQTASRVL